VPSYPDFPKPGVIFRDIFGLLRDGPASKLLKDVLLEYVKTKIGQVDAIVALDARGFLFGPLLSTELEIPFVPIRKRGKLPGELVSAEYKLEYGTDTFEMQKDSLKPGQKVLLIDDLLATGGSLGAACKLIESTQAIVHSCLVIMELTELKGRSKLPIPADRIHTLMEF